MHKTLTCAILGALLYLAGSCKKDESEAYKLQQACVPTAKAVKTIANAAGIVYFNQTLQQYEVSSIQ